MTAYSETENFINSLNEALEALNKSTGQKVFTPIDSIDEIRDGVLLGAIIEKFEYCCGRKRRVREKKYYQFIEDWLVTIGDMPYIPHYGKFVKHILKERGVDLIANIFGIVAITMFNNRHEMWHTFNVEIFFLCLGEPLIPKINRVLNQNLNIESDEKYAIVVQNRHLEKRVQFLSQKLDETIERMDRELKDKEFENQNKLSELKNQLNEKEDEISQLKNEIISLSKTIEVLTEENLAKNTKIESLRDLINGTDKTLVSTDELLSLKDKVSSMQSQMKMISTEMDKQFHITNNQPLNEKDVYHSFEVIPYKPPPIYRSSVTMFLTEKRKAPKTLIIPIQRESSIDSPPKATKRSSFKCVTFNLDESNDC